MKKSIHRSLFRIVRTSVLLIAIVFGNLAWATPVHAAATYYVSSSDPAASDTNAGTSSAAPWKTLAKVNAFLASTSHVAGDTILFKRGDTFVGTPGATGAITLAKSGTSSARTTFGAYGTGAKPVISGLATISGGWTSVGTNLWEITAPAGVSSLSTMVIGGQVYPLGRFPKEGSGTNGGYLAMSYNTSTGAQLTFTDSTGVLASQPNLTGAEVVIRPNHWTAARGTIGAHSGNTITLAARASSYTLATNLGFYIQNSPLILTQNGEWSYDATTRKIRLYYAGTPPVVQFSSVDNIFALGGFDYITIANLAILGGTYDGVAGNGSSFITISGNDIRYSGQNGVEIQNGNDILITDNIIADSQNTGVLVRATTLNNTTINNNTILNSGVRIGAIVPLTTGPSSIGINAQIASGLTIEGNTIDRVGYNGIHFNGSNTTIRRNIITNFNLELDDGAGIYSYGGANSPTNTTIKQYSNRLITENVISKGYGAPYGTISQGRQTSGIYFDNNSNNVVISNNTIFDVQHRGIALNSPQNIKVRGNTVFNSGNGGVSVCRWINDGNGVNGGQDVFGMEFTNNVFFNIADDQEIFNYCDHGVKQTNPTLTRGAITAPDETVATRIQEMVASPQDFNNNIYRATIGHPITVSYQDTSAGPYIYTLDRSVELWNRLSGFDANSTVLPTHEYALPTVPTTGLFSNSTFDTNISGVTSFGSSATMAWDNTSKLTGVGSLRITPTPTTNRSTTFLTYGTVGPVSSAKKYLLRFSTLGTTENGLVRVSLQKKSSPIAVLTPYQYGAFGTTRKDHEFIFVNPTDSSGTSSNAWHIDLYSASGTTYIDNVQVFEVNDATVVPTNSNIVFEYNDTSSTKTVALPAGTYYNVRDTARTTPYTSSVSIAPFSSSVFIKPLITTVVADTTAPTVSLTAPASGSSLSGTATLSATATDNVAVSKVDFFYGTTQIGSDTTAPYSVSWTTTAVPNGTYSLTARATDTANNVTTSSAVSVTVANADLAAPTVSLTAPTAGSSLSGTATLSATAADNVGVSKVDFYQGTSLIGTDTTAPYSVTWNTAAVANGTYSLTARATDSANNVTTSSAVSVTVANAVVDTIAPTVTVTAPLAGATVSGIVPFAATASDNVGVTQVQFYRGNTSVGIDTAAPYTSVSWDTRLVANGVYSITARARDAAGNITTSAPVSVTVANTTSTLGVTISSPTNGATVSGTVAMTATVTGSNITKVDFYRGTSTTPFATASSSYTIFLDTRTLTNGTHTFKAVVTNSSGATATSPSITLTVSNTITATPTTTGTPSEPTSVLALAGSQRAYLTWNAPLSSGGSAVTSYTVSAAPGGATVTTSTRNATMTGLTNGTSYTFTVRANNSVGAGTPTTSNTVTPVTNFPIGSSVRVVVSSSLTVRNVPGNGKKIGSVSNGTVGTVVANSSGWTQVAFPTVDTGWVSNSYIYILQ